MFACDPGGANMLFPLVNELQMKYHVTLLGKEKALLRYRIFGFKGVGIPEEEMGTHQFLESIFDRNLPDFIITATSANDFFERNLWQFAKQKNVPTLCIIDQWINLGIRFTDLDFTKVDDYYPQYPKKYLPDIICVIDDLAKNMLKAEGVPEAHIRVTGQPYFEYLLNHKKNTGVKTNEVMNLWDPQSDAFKLIFVSEPLTELYGEDVENIWGLSELTILSECVKSLKRIDALQRVKLIVKAHPRESIDKLMKKIHQLNSEYKCTIKLVSEEVNGWDLIQSSDFLIGLTSIFLLEAVLLGKPIASCMIGLNRNNPFILDKINTTKSILEPKALDALFRELIIDRHVEIKTYDFIKTSYKATQNIINLLEEMSCKS